MSHGRAIDPLPLQDFPTEQDVADPGFEQLFHDLVGDAGSDADGFDQAITDANALLDALDGSLSLLSGQDGGTLDEAFADILALDPAPAGDDVAALTTALPDVQSNVDNLGNLLNATLPSTPTGGAGALPAGCDALLGFDTNTNSPPITRDVTVDPNRRIGNQFIDSVTLDHAAAAIFTMSTTCAGTIPGGQTCTLTLTLTTAAPDGLHGKCTVVWHDETGTSYTAVLCLGVNTGDAFPHTAPGSGGTGGGGGSGGGGGGKGKGPPILGGGTK